MDKTKATKLLEGLNHRLIHFVSAGGFSGGADSSQFFVTLLSPGCDELALADEFMERRDVGGCSLACGASATDQDLSLPASMPDPNHALLA